MSTLILEREQVLDKVKELRTSTAKPDESIYDDLDLELASLHPTLPMRWLAQGVLIPAGVAGLIGYLYNWDVKMYVRVDSDNKWLYASEGEIGKAVRWNLYQDSIGYLVFNASIGTANMYFSWRGTTGACKLYDSYAQMTAKDWASDKFKMFNPNNSEYIGTWSSTDCELYNRQNVSSTNFGFSYFDKDAFTQDDHLIYNAYLMTTVS